MMLDAIQLDAMIPADVAIELQSQIDTIRYTARESPAIFAEYVMRDEETGDKIVLADLHKRWHDILSENDRAVIWSSIETGKSSQISVARVLWELGSNPCARIAIISNTHEQAAKFLRVVAKYIESSTELHQVFPELVPGDIWTAHQITVRRPTTSKDPSVQICGVHGNITGARIDILVMDDILDYENCRTEWLREDLYGWYHAVLSGRLTRRAKAWLIGTAYHPDDLMHRLAKNTRWYAERFPVINEMGESSWPERWPLARIDLKKEELGIMEFARQMLCQARDDAASRFHRSWIEYCMARGKRRGGSAFAPCLDIIPSGFKVYTGVDLAVSKKRRSDTTTLFTIGLHPTGTREVLCIESGKWTGPEIVKRIVDTHNRYKSIVYVENNAAQEYLVQFVKRDYGIPVKSFTTGANKHHPEFGVESIAVEMSAGKWVIPCEEDGSVHPEVGKWVMEMLYYNPEAHTGDRLMACWIAREASKARKGYAGYVNSSLSRR